MRRWKNVLFLICMSFLWGLLFQQPVEAAQVQLLSEQKGTLAESESERFVFQVPIKSNVTIAFVGLNDDDEGTYGDYALSIRNNLGAEVFSKSGRISFDNTNISITLEKGMYTLVLQENGAWNFEYVFSIKGAPLSNVSTKSLKVNKKSISLKVGGTYNLKATYTPTYATGNMTWKSSKPKVAKVSSNGKVEAKALGQAVITVKKGNKTAKCTVVVNSTYVELDKGSSKSLSGMLKNVSGYKKASWSSGNKSVASVSTSGKLKSLKHGKTKVTAKISGKTYTITAYVYDHVVLEERAKAKLKSLLRNPSSLVINSIAGTGNFVLIDYSAMNGYGGYNRETFSAWFEKGKLVYFSH